ncbi:unnamed protein product [Linum tenue]|uniref:DUF4283 domain-containing protein n=1 Tax=Linum tenue TaxID=586396 RepID=A0AAV0LAE9_9ROSI|nr:unnamed protein product [Linum tenue]
MWYKGFDPWKASVSSTLVWVHLPKLPIEFYNAEAVMQIAELIGKPVRVDRASELGSRAKFARVCVEVDLTKPMSGQYTVERRKYLIGYEGLQNICRQCGKYGKPTHLCDCSVVFPMGEEEEISEAPETQEEDPGNGNDYGDWMMVEKKYRRPVKKGAVAGQERGRGRNEDGIKRTTNRFQTLNDEEVVVEEGEKESIGVKGKQDGGSVEGQGRSEQEGSGRTPSKGAEKGVGNQNKKDKKEEGKGQQRDINMEMHGESVYVNSRLENDNASK